MRDDSGVSNGHDLEANCVGVSGGSGTQEVSFPLPEIHYPWAKYVTKLPSSSNGYISYSDILYNMPLSLLFVLKKIDDVC